MNIRCLVSVMLLSASTAFAESTPHVVAVMGEAEMLVAPDYATVDLGVVTQAQSASAALAENNSRMTHVLDALHSLGVSDTDIRTSEFSVDPRYEKTGANDYDPQALRPVIGYAVANKLIVTVHEMPKVARIIDAAVEAGANDLGRVDFEVKNQTDVMDRARRAAVDAAYHKAEILSAAAHVNLGPAISINDNEATAYYNGAPEIQQVVVTGARVATPIAPGQISVKSRITVVYEVR
jgi:uncharacterized protein YggE